MAVHPFDKTLILDNLAPWCFRVLPSLIVHEIIAILPISAEAGFWLLTIASLAVATGATMWFLQGLGLATGPAVAGGLAFVVLGPATGFTLFDYALVDPEAFALLALVCASVVHRRGVLLFISLALLAATKEMYVLGIIFAVVWSLEHRDWRMAGWAGAATAACMGIQAALHHWLVFPANPHETVTEFKWVLRTIYHNPLFLLGRAIATTVGTWNILLPFAALQLIHQPRIWRSWAFSLVLVAASLEPFVSGDVERLVVDAFPIMIAASVFEIEYLAQRTGFSRWLFWVPALGVGATWWYVFYTTFPYFANYGFNKNALMRGETVAIGIASVAILAWIGYRWTTRDRGRAFSVVHETKQ
jgi:hypothetical protein